MKEVTIYTDGACSCNPGIGGWAAVLKYNEIEKKISGYDKETTNNRMELFAVIQALRCLKQNCKCTIYSDSNYLVDAFNKGWVTSWQNNNWRTAGKSAVKNIDLWKALIYEINKHEVTFVWVKGHASNHYNNMCDEMAVAEVTRYKQILAENN